MGVVNLGISFEGLHIIPVRFGLSGLLISKRLGGKPGESRTRSKKKA